MTIWIVVNFFDANKLHSTVQALAVIWWTKHWSRYHYLLSCRYYPKKMLLWYSRDVGALMGHNGPVDESCGHKLSNSGQWRKQRYWRHSDKTAALTFSSIIRGCLQFRQHYRCPYPLASQRYDLQRTSVCQYASPARAVYMYQCRSKPHFVSVAFTSQLLSLFLVNTVDVDPSSGKRILSSY